LRHVFGQPSVADERIGGAEDGTVVQGESFVEAWGRLRLLNRLWHRVNQSFCRSFAHSATLNHLNTAAETFVTVNFNRTRSSRLHDSSPPQQNSTPALLRRFSEGENFGSKPKRFGF